MVFKNGNIPWNKDKKINFSEEHRRNLSKATKGKKKSEEHKRKLSESGKRRKQSEETKRKIGDAVRGEKNGFYGNNHTEESKKQISDAVKGDKHNNWQGGIGKLPYAFDFNEELKESIKKRDGYRCQFPECGTDIDLAVHHKDYDKMNSDPKNLITLCRKHNAKVNFNREHWTEHFNGVVT